MNVPSDVTFSVLNTFAVKFMCELRVHVVSGCFHRSGVHEVEHLGGGARHAALFTGELLSSLLSSSSPSILPTSLSLSVALCTFPQTNVQANQKLTKQN